MTENQAIQTSQEPFYVVFDGPPGNDPGRFVECETADGRGVRVGKWEEESGGEDNLAPWWRLGPFYDASVVTRLKNLLVAYGGPDNACPSNACDALGDEWCGLNCVAKAMVEGRMIYDGPPMRVELAP